MKPMAVTINWLIIDSAKVAMKYIENMKYIYEKYICKKYTRNIMKPMAVTINWLIPGSAKVAKKDKNLAELLQPIAIILFALSIIFPPSTFICTQYNSVSHIPLTLSTLCPGFLETYMI